MAYGLWLWLMAYGLWLWAMGYGLWAMGFSNSRLQGYRLALGVVDQVPRDLCG